MGILGTSGLPRPDLRVRESVRARPGPAARAMHTGSYKLSLGHNSSLRRGRGREDSPPGNWESSPCQRDPMLVLPHSWGWDLILQFSELARCLSLRTQLEQVQSKFSVVRKGAGGTREPKASCWPAHGSCPHRPQVKVRKAATHLRL